MKSLATKLVVMLVVTIILVVVSNSVSFITYDPVIGNYKAMAIDSINYAVNELLMIVKNHI